MDQLKAAATAAAAGDALGAVTQLLAAWRETHAPEVAAALDRVSEAALGDGDWEDRAEREDAVAAGWLVSQLRTVNAAAAAGRVASLEWLKEDPRVSAAIVALLQDPPFHATGAKPFWTRLFALLDASPDPRALPGLDKAFGEGLASIGGETMRAWMNGKVTTAREKLAKRFPSAPKTPPAIAKAAKAITFTPSTKPRVATQAGPRTERELFAAVYAAPDDDGPRAVLSDFLSERGDPRGEFIALQLRRTRTDEPGREGALLPKHQPAWLGELSGVVRYKNYYVYGPQPASWGMHIAVRWHRGFLAGANVVFTGPKLKKLGPLPEWATVEYALGLSADAKNEEALRGLLNSMRSLRGLAGHAALLRVAASVDPVRARLRQVNAWLTDANAVDTMAVLDTLPQLRLLEVSYTANAEALVRAQLWPRLEEVRFGPSYSQTQVRREGADVHLTLETGGEQAPSNSAQTILEAVDAKMVKSVTLRGHAIPQGFVDAARRFPVEPTLVKL
jgi:uncharacterized protein (TIGR02996 family)